MLWFHALSLKQWKALREKLPAGDQKLRDVQFWPTVHAAVMDLWLATFCKALIWESLIPNDLRFGFRAFLGIRALGKTSSQIQLIRKPFGRTKNMPKVRETPIVPRVPSWFFFHAFSLKKIKPANLSRLVESESNFKLLPSKMAILRILPLLYRFKTFHWRVQGFLGIYKK